MRRFLPKAESVVSSIRMDGSLPTQMAISALEVNNTFAEKVYFVKMDEDTKTRQIYSITADGKLETALINQEDFRKSNCYNPAISPDGKTVAFVRDGGLNGLYLVNIDGSNERKIFGQRYQRPILLLLRAACNVHPLRLIRPTSRSD